MVRHADHKPTTTETEREGVLPLVSKCQAPFRFERRGRSLRQLMLRSDLLVDQIALPLLSFLETFPNIDPVYVRLLKDILSNTICSCRAMGTRSLICIY